MTEDMQQILDELRNQTAMFKKANRTSMVVTCIFLTFVVLMFVLAPFVPRLSHSPDACKQNADSWREARSLADQGEHGKAEEMIQRLVKKYPNFWYGHSLLGSFHQELGNVKKAEGEYSKAYDLFPTEENKKNLAAIRAVLKGNETENK